MVETEENESYNNLFATAKKSENANNSYVHNTPNASILLNSS